MREITADCGSVPVIGIRHENGRTVARIPLGTIADIVAEYPGGSFTLGYRRRLDNQYWVCSDFVVEGDELIWTVGSHALGVAGDVIAQVSYSDGTVIAQTPRFRFSVGKSLFDGEEGQGENLSDLVEQAIAAVGQVDGKIAEAEEELDAAVAERIDGALGGLESRFQERIDEAIEEIGEHVDLSGKADKADTVLDTTLSRGRNAVDQVGEASFAFGTDVSATGNNSQAEGYKTVANGQNSHAEGGQASAGGTNAHAEGGNTTASGDNSHAEGGSTTANGANSHAEGTGTIAEAANSHAEGQESRTTAQAPCGHAEGYKTTVSGSNGHAEGNQTTASGAMAHAEGNQTTAAGPGSHAEGYGQTTQQASHGHAEGYSTVVSAPNGHAEGNLTTASGTNSHAEGGQSTASGTNSHAEGGSTTASGANSHAEGANSAATGYQAHAEGGGTTAGGANSHAEGTATIASGDNSHAEGAGTRANWSNSHAEGVGTIAYAVNQHVAGCYNVDSDPGQADIPAWESGTSYDIGDVVVYQWQVFSCRTPNSDTTFDRTKWGMLSSSQVAFAIGNGVSETVRNTCFAVMWDGSVWANRNIVIGNTRINESQLQALLALLN